MLPSLRSISPIILAAAGFLAGTGADAASIRLYADKYAGSASCWEAGVYSSCVDGKQPVITPSSAYVYDSAGQHQKTSATFAFTYDGHYATNWAFVQHGSVAPHLMTAPGNWYGLTVSYAELSELSGSSSGIDIVPFFAQMRYSLAYDPGTGGEWISGKQPAASSLWWSDSITAKSKGLCTRVGYSQIGWRPTADASGNLIECGKAMTGANIPVVKHQQSVTLYAQWQANDYTLQLQPGVGIDKIYYKTSASSEWQYTTVTQNVSVAFGETWSAYAVARSGYAHADTSAQNPASGTMGTDGATFSPTATACKYKLRLIPGTGIAKIDYKVNGATVWSSVAGETEIDVPYGTEWYACAEAATGYEYGQYTKDAPLSGTMGLSGATYNPVASVKSCELRLTVGTGIARIGYKIGEATAWTYVSATTSLSVDFGLKWAACAVPKAGYSCTATGSGTMGVGGAAFEPQATANAITVVYRGNGSTGGSTGQQTFAFDREGTLNQNGFQRTYTVSFDGRGATSPASRTSVCKFRRWNSAEDGQGGYSYDDQATVTNPCGSTGGTVNLYAQWDTDDESVVILPEPTYAGHTFAGWYDGVTEGAKKVGDATAEYVPTKNITLYAKWTVNSYTVTFRDGHKDAGCKTIKTQSVDYGASATPPEPPEHQYWQFTEWTGGYYAYVTADMTIDAQYEAKVYQLYYQSNYRNGQTEGTPRSGGSCGEGGGTIPTELTLKSIKWAGYAKTGYAFAGWDFDAAAAEPYWNPGDELPYWSLDEHPDGKLYAIWSPNSYTVRFDGNGATGGSTPDEPFVYDQAQTLTANGFTRAGQTFLRWHDAANGADYAEGQLVSNLTATANGTVTLTAVWSSYHYVRFDKNGATNESEDVVQTFSGAETNALSANVYGKTGYTFAGWATDAVAATNLCVTYTDCQEVAFPAAKANETNVLYAVWTTNRYTIAFDPSWPKTDEFSLSRYYFGEMASLANCAYDTPVTIRCGYTNYCSRGLLGWSKTKGATEAEYKVLSSMPSPTTQGGGTVVSNLTAAAGGTVTLYAVWGDAGDLSKAVGLGNAVLESVENGGSTAAEWTVENGDEDPSHRPCIRISHNGSGQTQINVNLGMTVVGAGSLGFKWYWEKYGKGNFRLSVDNEERLAMSDEVEWTQSETIPVAGEGVHAVTWQFFGTVKGDRICLDDIVWTPGVEVKPGAEPTFETESEAESAARAAKVVPPNAAVEKACTDAGVDYGAMFDVNVRQISAAPAVWSLVPALKPAVSNEVQAALDAGASNLVEALNGLLPTAGTLAVAVRTKAGLYYGISATNAVERVRSVAPTNWVLGTGEGSQSISVDRPSVEKGFFEFRATEIPPR